MDTINIKDEDMGKLIVELLVKNSVQLKILQDLMIMTLGASCPDQTRDSVLRAVSSSLVANHKKERDALLEVIFRQYGHIDLEGLL